MQQRNKSGDRAGEGVRGSSRHVRVDDRVAELLAQDFPVFSVVEVREACEFEPVRMAAIGILQWASQKPDPQKALLDWARKRSRGYYRSHRRRPSGTQEYRRCLKYLRRKEAEAVEKRGSGLKPRLKDRDVWRDIAWPGRPGRGVLTRPQGRRSRRRRWWHSAGVDGGEPPA